MNSRHLMRMAVLALAFCLCSSAVLADEGMWLFNRPPRKLLQKRYQFDASDAWLNHLQKSSVRFNNGGSGSFVSPDGLLMTNHHVARSSIAKLGSKEKNYIKSGFYAKTHKDELKCHDLELNVLISIEDVTERVKAAVKPEMSPAEAEKARRAVMNTVEKESLDKTGLRSDVVTLYRGGRYHLYRYKKYTDVRLVFAPEMEAAHFGGDPDNFEYPRYCLDVAFLRAYEDGKPAKVEHYLKWSPEGAKDGELIFVSGHPGRTNRLNTVAHLELYRDRLYPLTLNWLRRQEVLMKTYSERSDENARRAQPEYFGVQNSRKAYLGMLATLQDPAVIDKKRAAENGLREAVGKDPKLTKQYGKAWDEVAEALKELQRIYAEYYLLEAPGRGLDSGRAFNTHLFGYARTLVRLAEESEKPNADRLREYRESNLASLKQQLFSTAPIYADFETAKLADSLSMLLEMAGPKTPGVMEILGNKSPQERAAELVRGTKLGDPAYRKEIAAAGKNGVGTSVDPMIVLARLVDRESRRVRKEYEEKVDGPLQQAYGKIAHAVFAVKGQDAYPDATFTLRLAFGTVKGYVEDGRPVKPFTTLGGAFRHAEEHGNKEPFTLPRRMLEAKDRLKLETPLNFVSTADIIGGNSGSPVVNRNAELVGIIFDGNIQSLVLDYVYTEQQARALAVHSRGIMEALRKVYEATALADELTGKK
ncbi:MAG TPA: S46 family peptidase [Gemmataceae bacterium]|nr:S46 family peptidase [Gemmataceae bacterium]